MTHLLGEETLLSDDAFTITNHRVRIETESFVKSILIRNITYLEAQSVAPTWIYVLSVISLLIALGCLTFLIREKVPGLQDQVPLFGLVVMGGLGLVLLMIAIHLSKRLLIVRSAGGALAWEFTGKKIPEIERALTMIEHLQVEVSSRT